jgi:hypothetical protein
LLDSIDKFAHLFERQQLEARVLQLEEQLLRSVAVPQEGAPTLAIIDGGLADES